MKIDVLTLFPESFTFLENYGVIGRAIKNKKISLAFHNIRDYSTDKHKRVDDAIFGGEPGMLMTMQPIVDALNVLRQEKTLTVFLSPQGQLLNQEKANSLARFDHVILLCGHYEGIDARLVEHFIDLEISIGDYVLTGGEIPAMVLIDTVTRLLPGVLGNEDSFKGDSHYNRLLQHNNYTRPRDYLGYQVPDVLFSGNHKEIEAFKLKSSLENTKNKRPDLYQAYIASLDDNRRK